MPEELHITIKNKLEQLGHMCVGCAIRYLSVKVLLVCALLKPSSATEMLIQDVGPGRRTVYKPSGIGPATEDMTWQLVHGVRFSLDGPIKQENKEKLNPYYVVASWP